MSACAAAFGASMACISNARSRFRHHRVWLLLGLSAGSRCVGQVCWTYYEVVAGRQVPFPSIADIGYLLAGPLAAAGLLMLPSGTRSMAGRLRTLLDGLLIAASVLLISWQLVLVTVYQARTGNLFTDIVSLSYPIGDVVIVTIVAYAVLRARQSNERISAALVMVGVETAAHRLDRDVGVERLQLTRRATSSTRTVPGFSRWPLGPQWRTDWHDSFEPPARGAFSCRRGVLAALARAWGAGAWCALRPVLGGRGR
jgi:hypothetical protein